MAKKAKKIAVNPDHPLEALLNSSSFKAIPKVGDLVEGEVVAVSKNEVKIDINGLTTGSVRGKEIYDESGENSHLKIGDKVIATVLELENEQGEMELSFRHAGHKKAWENLTRLQKEKEITEAKVVDANKGGLMIKVGNVAGFLPVSQLTMEKYPRVEGGDKSKILTHLRQYLGQSIRVKIIDVNEQDEKLIVSERAAWEEKQSVAMSKYKVGDTVSGKITGVVDFGAFIEFGDGLEGLIHISELAWQRIDDPKEVVKVGDIVEAEIISLDDSKISLSTKRLKDDPWKKAAEKYNIGQKVTGKVLKINPFGAFVELDQEIHGLIHISELPEGKNKPDEVLEINKSYEFTIITIEPRDHRLGLSMRPKKAAKSKATTDEKAKAEKEEKSVSDQTEDNKAKDKKEVSEPAA